MIQPTPKPHIWRVRHLWHCSVDMTGRHPIGYGIDPKEAFEWWLRFRYPVFDAPIIPISLSHKLNRHRIHIHGPC